jgi:hypothetical protein
MENQIVSVHLDLIDGRWGVTVEKTFEPRYGGGSQRFRFEAGPSVHHALDIARGLVTVSPGGRMAAGDRYPGTLAGEVTVLPDGVR